MPPSDSPSPDRSPLTIEHLIFLHTVAIVEFGGSGEIRDPGLLKSALARPLSGFGDVRLFTTPFARAAALMEALLRNHPFVDGNKRVAVMAAAFWLEQEGHTLTASQDDLVDTTLAVINRRMTLDALATWFEISSTPLGSRPPER